MSTSKPAPPHELHGGARNPGTDLDLTWLDEVAVDGQEVERRARYVAQRAPTESDRVDHLLRVVGFLDLTTLAEDDTEDDVLDLCARARAPIESGVLEELERGVNVRVAAVCIHDRFIPVARKALAGGGVRIAAVTAGFPRGHASLPQRLAEIRAAVAAGADEVDVVVTRRHVLAGDWTSLYDEVRAFRDACDPAHLKTILAAGDLSSLDAVARASLVCMMAGADFIKTSTGRETINATLPIGLVMVDAIGSFAERVGYAVGLKPAGGIRTAEDASSWLALMDSELGLAWLTQSYFRIGASSLLTDLRRQLSLRPTKPS